MSLYERLTEQRSSTTFTKMKGSDSFQHTDRHKDGRRNKTPQGTFVFPKYKRYPVNAFSRASAAGSLRQAYKRGVGSKVAAKVKASKALKMCPTGSSGCPEKRDHGPGGKPEHKTSCSGKHCDVKDKPADHGGKHPWKFNVGKEKWAGSDWAKPAKKGKPAKKTKQKMKKTTKKTGQ